jgi:hypothetical protein
VRSQACGADVDDGRPVLVGRRLNDLAGHAPAGGVVPDRDVQDDLPDAVPPGQRPRGGARRVHAAQDLEHRGAVPGFALEGAPELVGDS